MADEIAAGDFSQNTMDELARAFRAWLRSDGAIPLERHLGLPTTTKTLQLIRRDRALIAAAREIQAKSTNDRAAKLAREMSRYATSGDWRQWRGVSELPVGVPPLRRAVHLFLMLNGGRVLGVRQLRNLLGGTLSEFLPTDAPKVRDINTVEAPANGQPERLP